MERSGHEGKRSRIRVGPSGTNKSIAHGAGVGIPARLSAAARIATALPLGGRVDVLQRAQPGECTSREGRFVWRAEQPQGIEGRTRWLARSETDGEEDRWRKNFARKDCGTRRLEGRARRL